MAVLISLGGNPAGNGFLIAPLGSNYDADLVLTTDAGTLAATIQASPNAAGLVFSQTNVNLSTTPTVVKVHSTLQSAAAADTTIQVLDGPTVVASFTVTSIKQPVVNFNGRFETRFATDGIFPNTNPMYTAVNDNLVGGWTWGLEGEPDFVPAVGNVPTNLEMTGVGRVVRLNNPVALRTLGAGTVPAVVSTVVSITGKLSGGADVTFTTGDPLIGQPVNFGPDTYIAGNNDNNALPGIAGAEEVWGASREPLALFQLRLGTSFSPPAVYLRGASKVGPFVAPTAAINTHTRNPDSRPIPNGLPNAAAEFAEFGIPELQAFSETRVDALVLDYLALPAGASPQRRNLVRRIGHLLGSVSAAKIASVQAQAVPPDVFTVRVGTVSMAPPTGWKFKEVFNGKVDADLHAFAGASPGFSSVIEYLRQFFSFNFQWHAFAFHSDENCGHHKGTLTGDLTMTGNSIGDPHQRTVNGINYDFQGVGEFTLLRNGTAMEIQVRTMPVATANPITDGYSGLTTCVSLNTAVAARIGKHRIAYQPGREGRRLEFYVDGKPAALTAEGADLAGSRVAAFDANGEIGLRVDCADGTILLVTPMFWNAHQVWYLNVSVSNTTADEGLMGYIPKDSWLPRLRDGQNLGPMPAALNDRYVALYKKFADSWRVTDTTSLFVYAPGTSTKTFTDPDWPAEKPPCKLKPEFQIPGVGVHASIPAAEAERICRGVIDKDLHQHCVFDVATTGDKFFAEGYLFEQELRLYGTKVEITGYTPAMLRPDRSIAAAKLQIPGRPDQWFAVTATVSPLTPGRPTPTGTVTFFVDGVPMKRPVELDDSGSARLTVGPLRPGEHRIRATYSGGGRFDYHSSSSPNLLHVVAREREALRS